MYAEDQLDQRRFRENDMPWEEVERRDREREEAVRQALREGRLRTGADYCYAAMILHHGRTPEDDLLAHEFAVLAAAKGSPRARWLAAAIEDRFLRSIGRPQRFSTQHGKAGEDAPVELYPVNPSITDELRLAFDVPPPEQTMQRVARRNTGLDDLSEPLRRQAGCVAYGCTESPPQRAVTVRTGTQKGL